GAGRRGAVKARGTCHLASPSALMSVAGPSHRSLRRSFRSEADIDAGSSRPLRGILAGTGWRILRQPEARRMQRPRRRGGRSASARPVTPPWAAADGETFSEASGAMHSELCQRMDSYLRSACLIEFQESGACFDPLMFSLLDEHISEQID